MSGLTRQQSALLDFIRAYQAAHRCAPSYREMQTGIGTSSKSGVHRLVTGLEERGHVRRLPGRARSVEVVGMPNAPTHSDLRYRQLCRRLHALGPRPVGELILHLQRDHGIPETELMALLERYAAVDAGFLRALGGDDWPAPLALTGGC